MNTTTKKDKLANKENGNKKNLFCLNIINQAVSDTPGIAAVQLDAQHQQLSFDYNPNEITESNLKQIAENLKPSLLDNIETCLSQLEDRICEACVAQTNHQPACHCNNGVLNLTYTQNSGSARLDHLGVDLTDSSQEKEESSDSKWSHAWKWFSGNPEAVFTLITLLAMSSGWLVEYFAGPNWLHIALFVVAYVAGGVFGLKAGIESLKEWTIDVDLLMILAALGAAVVGAPFEGAMLLFLFSLSNVLQDYAMDRTRNAIRSLMQLRPEQAHVRRGSRLVTLPIDQVVIGDRYMVRPGDRIPLDGTVLEGESAVDQSPITGESVPVSKSEGDSLLAGTINKNGSLEAKVTKLAKDSTLSKMIQLVEDAQANKAPTQRFLDKAEQYYATGVIIFTLLAIFIPIYWLHEIFQTSFYRAMTIMVAASPCALVISTPASILSAIGNGARKGILFKGGSYVERAADLKVVAFDKTGTLTQGEPVVTDVKVIANTPSENGHWHGDEDALLKLTAAVEAKSEHVLAQATLKAAQERDLELPEVTSFQATTGKGIQGTVEGYDIRIGSLRYFEEFEHPNLETAQKEVEKLQNEGKTSIIVAQIRDEGQTAHILGVVAYADQVRSTAADVVKELKSLGVERVVMLTGDNERTAKAIADQVGVDEYYADLMPEDKVRLVQELEKKYGAIAMVGDGVNDAPALATATIGIAMGAAGTDVALETADIVLLADELKNIPYVIDLSRQTRKTLIANLGFAMAAIVVMLASIFSIGLSLPLAVVGHEGGTVLVSLNGLRLLVYKRK